MSAAQKLIQVAPRLPLGIHTDIAAELYHEPHLGVVSKSALDHVNRSPAHYRAWLDGHGETTPALQFGTAFHCALLEPKRFSATYATEPDFGDCRKADNKTARNEWRLANAGRTLLAQDDEETIRSMVSSVRSHKLAGKMIADGIPESTISWIDSTTGLPCKCRPDYYVKARRMAVDAKSAEDASPEGFKKAVGKYGYHVQNALYSDGFRAVGERVDHFVFVAVEKKPPFAVGIYTLGADAIARGYSAARRGVERLAECVQKDEWPAYSSSIETIDDLPPWV